MPPATPTTSSLPHPLELNDLGAGHEAGYPDRTRSVVANPEGYPADIRNGTDIRPRVSPRAQQTPGETAVNALLDLARSGSSWWRCPGKRRGRDSGHEAGYPV